MTDYTSNVVIIEHPTMFNRHVIGYVLSQTKLTVNVIYWDIRLKTWKEDANRRQLRAVVGSIGIFGSIPESKIQSTAENLISFTAEVEQRIKNARSTYANKILAKVKSK